MRSHHFLLHKKNPREMRGSKFPRPDARRRSGLVRFAESLGVVRGFHPCKISYHTKSAEDQAVFGKATTFFPMKSAGSFASMMPMYPRSVPC